MMELGIVLKNVGTATIPVQEKIRMTTTHLSSSCIFILRKPPPQEWRNFILLVVKYCKLFNKSSFETKCLEFYILTHNISPTIGGLTILPNS